MTNLQELLGAAVLIGIVLSPLLIAVFMLWLLPKDK